MSRFCVICNDQNGPLITLTEKGQKSLQHFSKKRDDDEIYKFLTEAKANNNEVFVHASCRKKYTDKRNLSKLKDANRICTQKQTRNVSESFN